MLDDVSIFINHNHIFIETLTKCYFFPQNINTFTWNLRFINVIFRIHSMIWQINCTIGRSWLSMIWYTLCVYLLHIININIHLNGFLIDAFQCAKSSRKLPQMTFSKAPIWKQNLFRESPLNQMSIAHNSSNEKGQFFLC